VINKCLSFLLACATSFAAHAESTSLKVSIAATADDLVGGRLVYAIKEGVRRSAGMQLVNRVQDGLIQVKIVTLDPDKDNKSGSRTIYSVVWTLQTFHNPPVTMYLTNSVGFCGSARVAQCADGLVADTDAQVSEVRGWIESAMEGMKE